jgi:hypothetical protein
MDSNIKSPESLPQSGSGQPPGIKLDKEKPNLDMVLGGFARALWAVGEIGTHGAHKYTADGWVHVPNGSERYGSALLRHYLLYRKGETCDRESGRNHLAHIAWNALAILDLALREEEKNATSNSST